MAHCVVPQAEEILDKIPVLDKGFVRLVDYLGRTPGLCNPHVFPTAKAQKSTREDGALIDYLLRNQHTSPSSRLCSHFT